MPLVNASPACTVNNLSTVNGVNVSTPSTVTVALASPAGVGPWTLTCVGTDELNTTAAVNASLTISQVTYTATFPAPAAGSALRFQSQVNGGINSNGVVDPTLTTTLTVYALTGNGYRVCAFGETMEGSAAFGWLSTLNPMLRNALGSQAAAGAGLNYSGGVYSVGQNADNSIVVNAHDIQLKTSFTTLLNGATSAATASTLVERDGSGNCAFATVTAAAATLSNVTVQNAIWTTTTGSGHRASVTSAPTGLERFVGDGASFPQDKEVGSNSGGNRWTFCQRFVSVGGSSTIPATTIGYIYVDASYTKCGLLTATVNFDSFSHSSVGGSAGLLKDCWVISAGFQNNGSNYVVTSFAVVNYSASGAVTIAPTTQITVDGLAQGARISGPAWFPVVLTATNNKSYAMDIMMTVDAATAW